MRALERLHELAAAIDPKSSSKYAALVEYLKQIGVGGSAPTRAVIFAERVATLKWLQTALPAALKLRPENVAVLHGGLTDVEQLEIIGEFKLESSKIRVLVTGDIASEGVNLHAQCHELIHFDIPWSLIRIEQRNGRIDRYGQRVSPQITTLLLNPSNPEFSGDLRILTRLLEREQEAHAALGDTASLMGQYDVDAEEAAILRALAEGRDIDDVVRTVEEVRADSSVDGFFARLLAPVAAATAKPEEAAPLPKLFATDADYLSEALEEAYNPPGATPKAGGVAWRKYADQSIVEFSPPPDLQQRLGVLPQSYLTQRQVIEHLKLATSTLRGKTLLANALKDQNGSQWPEAHYLGPLHPVLDWASDRALSSLGRNQVFAIRSAVEEPTVVLLGTLTNRRGQVMASSFLTAAFPVYPSTGLAPVQGFESAEALFEAVGLIGKLINPGAVPGLHALQQLVRPAVRQADGYLSTVVEAARSATSERVSNWSNRVSEWEAEANALVQRKDLKQRRITVEAERALAESMQPHRQLVRPLLVIVPEDWDTTYLRENA